MSSSAAARARRFDHGGGVPAGAFGNGCRGKVRHTSKKLALGQLRLILKRDPGACLNAYHCKVCKGWHVGNTYGR